MSTERPLVLVVDDDDGCRNALRRALGRAGMVVDPAASFEEAVRALERAPACVVTEFRLPDGAGVDLLARAREADPHVGRVILTGVVDPDVLQDAVNRGAVHAFFGKPWDTNALVQGIRSTIEQCRLARTNRELMDLLADRNRKLLRVVAERTGELERAKRELEAVFDAWSEPVALVGQGFIVLRANRAYAARGGLGVRDVPGRRCHEALFGTPVPCPGCPLAALSPASTPGPVTGRAGPAGTLAVRAQPLAMPDGGGAFLCRYGE